MISIEVLAQVILGGVLIGGLYALVAFGLSLIYGVVRILNFSHGTLLAVGGVLASTAYATWGISLTLMTLFMTPLFFAYGYLFFKYLLEPLSKKNHFESTVGTVLVTVGALLIMSDLTAKFAGPAQKNINLQFDTFEIAGVIISTTQIIILLGIILLTLALHYFLRLTWYGRAVKAVTQEPLGARLCGINSGKIKATTFAFGSATVFLASILYALSFPVDPYIGFGLTVKAFTIIILGGIGNLPGALLAGIFIGVAEGLTGLFWKPEWAPALSVILLLVILIIFPQGFQRSK
jgi:branched-chain amino acid transport system permease protein